MKTEPWHVESFLDHKEVEFLFIQKLATKMFVNVLNLKKFRDVYFPVPARAN